MTSAAEVERIWRRYDAMEARLTAPLSARMLALAGIAPGMRVLDLATGRGEPAIAAAQAVLPDGRVLGVDVMPEMLAMARERANEAGVTNLDLHAIDAADLARVTAPRSFDAALARWGLMYMTQPREALSATRRALVDGAPLVLAVWCEPERVDYWELPRRVLAELQGVPLENARDAPGPFRYADASALTADLEATGFVATHAEEHAVAVMEGATAREAVEWVRAFGMARVLESVSEDVQREWEARFVAAVEARRTEGMIHLGGVTRLVTARAV